MQGGLLNVNGTDLSTGSLFSCAMCRVFVNLDFCFLTKTFERILIFQKTCAQLLLNIRSSKDSQAAIKTCCAT